MNSDSWGWRGSQPSRPKVSDENAIAYARQLRPSEMGTVQERLDRDRFERMRQRSPANQIINPDKGMARGVMEGMAKFGQLFDRTSPSPSETPLQTFQKLYRISQEPGEERGNAFSNRQEADEWGLNSEAENRKTYDRWIRETGPVETAEKTIVNSIFAPSGDNADLGDEIVGNATNSVRWGPSEEWKRNYYKVTGAATGEDPEQLYRKGEEYQRQNWNKLYGSGGTVEQSRQQQGARNTESNTERMRRLIYPDGTIEISGSGGSGGAIAQPSGPPLIGRGETPLGVREDNSSNVLDTRSQADYDAIQTKGLDEIQGRSNKDLGKLALLAGLMKLGNSLGTVTTGRWW